MSAALSWPSIWPLHGSQRLLNSSILRLRNAAYWYRRAGRPACKASLEEEWASIAEALLGP